MKAGLKGHTFLIGNESLDIQSDGTNSHKFIEIALELLISLSRRDYISPIIYIDEPEIGLHPKRNEVLIYNLFKTYNSFKKTKITKEKGKYKTPYPTIIFATHSANIVKEVIKLFDTSQQVLHFSKNGTKNTTVQLMKSNYKDKRFLNIFSDNESRLFFSTFILFVEGETELEIFRNQNLVENFNVLTNIDVYKSSSNVFGAHINPSYANTTIPYLFLFDADKIYSFCEEKQDKTRKKIKLLNSNKALYFLPDGKKENEKEFNTLIDIYKKGFNKRYASKLNNLLAITNIQNITFTIDEQSFKINERTQYLEQIRHLKTYLNSYNVSFVHTTIEEVLINKKSEALFYKWLKFKFSIDVEEFLYDKRELEYSYSCYKKRLGIGRLVNLKPREVIQKKITYLNPKYESYIIEEFVNYIRVRYFEGKFEILNNKITEYKKTTNKKDKNNFISMKTSLYAKLKQMNSNLNTKQKENLEKIFNNYLDVSSSTISKNKEIEKIVDFFPLNIQGKTSGWATSFLSFSINELKNNNSKISFKSKFKKNFKELYDIITIIEKRT